MNDWLYIYYSIKSRGLNSTLSVLLTSFGVLIALLISQFSNHIKNRLSTDGKNIDIVVGAKGSPLQLVLSSVYHIDIPTGNIPLKSTVKLTTNPMIEKSIPIALGDNWKGFRIVGTTLDYIEHFNGKIDKGRLWGDDFEMVAGADVDLKVNEKISGAHGIMDGGVDHDEHSYNVVGVLKPTGSVLDRLLLTSVNSVLEIHGLENVDYHNKNNHREHSSEQHKNHEHEHDHNHEEHKNEKHKNHEHKDEHEKNETHEKFDNINSNFEKKKPDTKKSTEPEITALLIKTKSPIANVNLPRSINRETNMQAANPALEITRLTTMLGLGSKSFAFLSILLISIAILSIFSGLASNLENRLGDLAILRAIGYSKKRIFKIIALEGALIIFFGIILGVIMGFGTFEILSHIIAPLNVSKANFAINSDFFIIIVLVLIAGIIASVIPAYKGSKISVANQLSQNI